MGYTRHHAIIVTSYSKRRIKAAHEKAREIFPYVSEILQSVINTWDTFIIPPDGSKEGWEDSDRGDERRAQFVEWLNQQRFSDGSTPYDWAEVQYGDDESDNRVLHHEDEMYGVPGVLNDAFTSE